MSSPLDRPATPERLRALEGAIPPDALNAALAAVHRTPPAPAWGLFLDRLLLYLGAALISSGVIYFFAWNWDDLDRIAKLGLPILGAGICATAAWRAKLSRVPGKVALTVASVLVGVSIATYGQVYQTGADAWELFAIWAALIVPWTLAGRFQALWTIWIVVAQLAVGAWWVQILGPEDGTWLPFTLAAITGALWAARELGQGRERVAGRWMPRALCAWTLALLTGLSLLFVFQGSEHMFEPIAAAAPGALALLVVGGLSLVWGPRRDLFLPAAALGAWIIVASTAAGRLIFLEWEMGTDGLIVQAFAVIVQAALAAAWLRARALDARTEGVG